MASPAPSTRGPLPGIKSETPIASASPAFSNPNSTAPCTPITPRSTYQPPAGFQPGPQAIGQQNPPRAPAKQMPLSFGTPLLQPTLISNWQASILFNAEYTDCFLTVQNECIPVHRAIVLAQSSYLRTICLPDPEKNGEYKIDVAQDPAIAPQDAMRLVVKGVLYAMYGNRSHSALPFVIAGNRPPLKPVFLARAYVLAGVWKAPLAAEAILNDICEAWATLDLVNVESDREALCQCVFTMWQGLSKNSERVSADCKKIGENICIEFVTTNATELTASRHLAFLARQFPELNNKVTAVLAREGRKKGTFCKRCPGNEQADLSQRRKTSRAYVADEMVAPCAICRALDGSLNIDSNAGTSPLPQPQIPKNPSRKTSPTAARATGTKRPAPSKDNGQKNNLIVKKRKQNTARKSRDDPDAEYKPHTYDLTKDD